MSSLILVERMTWSDILVKCELRIESVVVVPEK